MEKVRVLGRNVLVRVDAEDEVSAGGIILVESAKEVKVEGCVMGVGEL